MIMKKTEITHQFKCDQKKKEIASTVDLVFWCYLGKVKPIRLLIMALTFYVRAI